jgi:flavodoxin
MSEETKSPVKQCEELYPETTAEFKKILNEQYTLFCKKQLNYGPDNISVGTRCEKPEEIKLSLTGLWFRMNDKINRLKQLVLLGHEDTVGESVQDSYQDLSVYGIIAQIVSRGKWGK